MPIRQPDHFEWLENEPEFNPSKHLQLEKPDKTWNLTDFGYTEAESNAHHFNFAMCAPFRMLSAEGVATINNSIKQLQNTKIALNASLTLSGAQFIAQNLFATSVTVVT